MISRRRFFLALLLPVLCGLFLWQCNRIEEGANGDGSLSDDYWIAAIGGAGSDLAPSFCLTGDDIVVAGMTTSFGLGDGGGIEGSHDLLAMKLDRMGNVLWSKTIGGPGDERGSYGIWETRDGGYLLTGSTTSFGTGDTDIFLVKLSAFGALVWAKTIGGPGTDIGKMTMEMTDGYVLIGESDSFIEEEEEIVDDGDPADTGDDQIVDDDDSDGEDDELPGEKNMVETGGKDILMVKITPDGTLAWARIIGGPADDAGSSIRQVPGGYVIGATVSSFGSGDSDACLIKIDNSANIIWANTIGGSRQEGISDSFRVGSDGGFLFSDTTGSFDAFGGGAFFGIKLTADCALQWCTMVDGPGLDGGWTIHETGDGFIGGGKYASPEGEEDALVVKFDQTGALNWARTLGNTGLDEIREIRPVERGYILAGVTGMEDFNGDILIARINGNGHVGGSDPLRNINPLNIKSISPVIFPCTPATRSVTKEILVTDVIPTVTIPALQVRKLNE